MSRLIKYKFKKNGTLEQEIKNVSPHELAFVIGNILEALAKNDYVEQRKIVGAIVDTNEEIYKQEK